MWVPIGVAAYTFIFGTLFLMRKAAMSAWYIETDDEGFTLNLNGTSYIRYDELKAVDRNGDDITFRFKQAIPTNIVPGLVLRKIELKVKVRDAESLVGLLSERMRGQTEADPQLAKPV